MIALNAHYDGKVIVPDEPLSLKPDQKLRISIETIDAEPAPRQHDPGADEDALWQKGPLPKSAPR